jgi:hypothetical protein
MDSFNAEGREMIAKCPRCEETLYLNGDMEITEGCACAEDGDDYTDHEWSLIYSSAEYDVDRGAWDADFLYDTMKEEGRL